MANNNGKHAKGSEAKAAPVVPAVPEATGAVEPAPSESAEVAAPVALAAITAKSADKGFAAAFDASFDASKWSTRSFDIWNENTTAFFDFAEKLTKAKTIDEAADLQTRFISERVETLMRQSTELLTLAQEMMNVTVAPFYGAKAA